MKYHPQRLRRLDRVWLEHGQPTYFVTIRAGSRGNTLANEAVHQRLHEFLLATASHHDWWASRYVLMPDHLHLFATPGLGAVTLGAWIKALKACVADRQFRWQTGFFDHALRGSESQSQKWEYIRQNPVRAGLTADADAWPFGGEIDWAQGDVNPPPGQETRPTTAPRTFGATDVLVGPVSRPGGGATSHADNAGQITPPPRQETRPTTGAKSSVGSNAITLVRHGPDGRSKSQSDYVAVEEPLEIRIEGHSVAVVMRTPGHDRELAAGFLLTENLVRSATDIFEITQCGNVGPVSRPGGAATTQAQDASDSLNVVNVTLRNPAAFDPSKLTRNVFSSSSCGVCSKATIEAVRQSFALITSTCSIRAETLLRLPAALREKQETFNQTGGLHACALFDLAGTLQEVREDVGRHNALDKLIGHALLEDRLPLHDQVLLLSGRISFEMMQKALAAGIPIVAAISAPTTLAVEFARENNQTLIGFLRGETMNIYSGAERIIAPASA